jgi:hypothetical protein
VSCTQIDATRRRWREREREREDILDGMNSQERRRGNKKGNKKEIYYLFFEIVILKFYN